MEVRPARPDELPLVMGVLDAASLAVDAGDVRERIATESVVVAVANGPILGACVLAGDEITAIAVRRRRRDHGIGTRLVRAATASVEGPLVAEFHRRVRPFYESLGFSIEPTAEPDRFRGRCDGARDR